jgi:nucleoid-associated protein YgaU
MNQFQALMAGFATVVGVGGVAAYNSVFSSSPAIVQEAAKTNDQAAAALATVDPAKVEPAPVEVAKVDPVAVEPAIAAPESAPAVTTTEEAPKAPDTTVPTAIVAPTFDVLRVEANGSVLIAGKAEKDAQVEVLAGADVLGITKAQPNGDFAIVIENPLKPGDYQLVLRQTLAEGTSATSVETATVSVPEKLDGPVLALVEEPGKPSRIITTPQTVETPKAVTPQTNTETQVAVQNTDTATPAVEPAPTAIDAGMVNIEAVETEGKTIFVAGVAKGVATVRVYANELLLGDTKPLAGGRFLLEAQKELALGDYIFKAEGLASDGVTILGRSTVPFKSGNAETIAAATKEAAPAAQDANAVPATTDVPKEKKLAVIIRRGDTLWQISRRIYGRGVRYSTIYLANKDAVPNPNMIFPGQVMAIPDATPEGDAASSQEIEKRAIGE